MLMKDPKNFVWLFEKFSLTFYFFKIVRNLENGSCFEKERVKPCHKYHLLSISTNLVVKFVPKSKVPGNIFYKLSNISAFVFQLL